MTRSLRPLPVVAALLAVISIVLAGCSTKKDGFAYRVYHNTTAHFNGFFNAGEIIRKSEATVKAAHVEDYDNILPVFIKADEEMAKSLFPDMEKAIAKCEKVISRHTITNESKKGKKRPVLNKWIDENYLLVGIGHFYKSNYFKAEQTFQFINRKYKDKNAQALSATWLARTYIEREEYSKAIQALNRVEIEGEMDDDVRAFYYLVFTDNLLRQGKLEQAAEKLEMAIKHTRRKKDRARPHFILAQIYQQLNKSSEAQTEYEAVVHSRPPYELEFQARINKALSFSRRGGSSAEIRKELMKMLKDEKNKSYRDQIYYALGDIDLEEQLREDAIYNFEQSLATNEGNKKQKAKTYLRLADLYFDQRQYEDAQMSYDSTLTNITEAHPRYKEIKARAESLGELVQYLDIITMNDSVISLCNKSEAEREKMLLKAQRDIEREMERKRREDEERAAQAIENAIGGITGNFWAYNNEMRAKGQENFKDTWGDRPLKDNWRLQSRVSVLFDAPDEALISVTPEPGADPNAPVEDKYKVPSLDELRAELPCGDDQKMAAATASVAEAYYQCGVIYKENLDDDDNAIASWEELLNNLDQSDFHPVAHYQLFRTWLSKEQLSNYKKNPFCSTCDSKYWGERIKELYPGSEWAMLVDNPEYMDIRDLKETEEREAYEATYRLYTERNYPAAITACNQVISTQPENHLLCKYRLLRAVCVGYTDASYGVKENYLRELNEVKTNCGNSDEGKRADELLKAANQEDAGSASEPEKGPDESTGEDPEQKPEIKPDPPVANYTFDDKAEHYVAIVLPVQGTDINKVKPAISDFNATFYTSSNLKVTNNLLEKSQHIIVVKPFKTIPEAREYLSTFESDETRLKDVNSAGPVIFLISKQNYIQLFKSKDLQGYLEFYGQNY